MASIFRRYDLILVYTPYGPLWLYCTISYCESACKVFRGHPDFFEFLKFFLARSEFLAEFVTLLDVPDAAIHPAFHLRRHFFVEEVLEQIRYLLQFIRWNPAVLIRGKPVNCLPKRAVVAAFLAVLLADLSAQIVVGSMYLPAVLSGNAKVKCHSLHFFGTSTIGIAS